MASQPHALALYIVLVYAVAAPLFEFLCALQIRYFPIVGDRLLALYARQGEQFLTAEELDKRYSEQTARRSSRLSMGQSQSVDDKNSASHRDSASERAVVMGQQRTHATPAN